MRGLRHGDPLRGPGRGVEPVGCGPGALRVVREPGDVVDLADEDGGTRAELGDSGGAGGMVRRLWRWGRTLRARRGILVEKAGVQEALDRRLRHWQARKKAGSVGAAVVVNVLQGLRRELLGREYRED